MEYKYWFVHNPVSGTFPKVKHDTFNAASSEAQCLAANNPGTVFFVLEAVAAACFAIAESCASVQRHVAVLVRTHLEVKNMMK